MSRVFVYIDGRNFFYGLKSLDNSYTDLNFDFVKFSKMINGVNCKKRKLEKIYYYNAPLKKQVNARLFSLQQKLFSRLRAESLVEFRLCKMLGRTDSQGNLRYDIQKVMIFGLLVICYKMQMMTNLILLSLLVATVIF